MEEPDNEWMEEICISEVEEYFEAWKDDTPASSLTQSWVRKHNAATDIGSITVDLHSQHESAVQSSSVATERLGLPDNLTSDMSLQCITTSGLTFYR